MTKTIANDMRTTINSYGKRYATYFSSKAQTLSFRVYSYTNNTYDKEMEEYAIIGLLNKVAHAGYRNSYKIVKRTYQGFIHDTDVIFS